MRLVPDHQKHPQDKKLFDLWVFFHIKINPLMATLATLIHLLVQNCICLHLVLNQDLQDFEDYRGLLRFKHKGHL